MVLNRLIVMYKLMFLAMNRIESGVITNKWYQSAAITPAYCQSAHSRHSACQSIARLLHQSASRVACSVCVTPPFACVYSLLNFFELPNPNLQHPNAGDIL